MATKAKVRRLSGSQEIDAAFQAAEKRMRGKGITDKDTLIEGMISEARKRGLFSEENHIRFWRGYIANTYWSRQAMKVHQETKRRRQKLRESGIEPIQLSFLEEDAELISYSLPLDGILEQIPLGDFGVNHIDIKLKLDDQQLSERSDQFTQFKAAASQVRPLLLANPTWKWADAARYLRDSA